MFFDLVFSARSDHITPSELLQFFHSSPSLIKPSTTQVRNVHLRFFHPTLIPICAPVVFSVRGCRDAASVRIKSRIKSIASCYMCMTLFSLSAVHRILSSHVLV